MREPVVTDSERARRERIGLRLERLRKERGLQSWRLGAAAGVGDQTYRLYEKGISDITSEKLCAFAGALGMTPAQLAIALLEEEQATSSFSSWNSARSMLDRVPQMVGA